MTDESTVETQEQEESEHELEAVISVPPTDAVLELLVTLSEYGVHLPVTLFVKGIIITGNVISFEAYMNRTTDGIRGSINSSGMDEENFKELTEIIADSFDRIRTGFLQHADENTKRELIHLENVRMFNQNGNLVNLSDALWRGALGSIDGWILGNLSQT